MKSMVVIAGLFLALHPAAGQDGKVYGNGVTLAESVSVAEVLQSPEMFKGKKVMIEGEISDVCQKKGCWIKVKDLKGEEEIQVKVEDDVIVFPKDGKGRKVRAEGTISVTVLTEQQRRDRARHEAEEQGTLKDFDESKIQGSLTSVRMEGEGAVIE